jgi:hypothetical protein
MISNFKDNEVKTFEINGRDFRRIIVSLAMYRAQLGRQITDTLTADIQAASKYAHSEVTALEDLRKKLFEQASIKKRPKSP